MEEEFGTLCNGWGGVGKPRAGVHGLRSQLGDYFQSAREGEVVGHQRSCVERKIDCHK